MTAERKIGPNTFRVEKLNAVATSVVGRRIINLIGPGLGHLREAMGKDGAAAQAAGLACVAKIGESLDERYDALVVELARMAQVKWNGAWMDVDPEIPEHVPDIAALYELVFFVLQVNFRSFFSGPLAQALASRIHGSPTNS